MKIIDFKKVVENCERGQKYKLEFSDDRKGLLLLSYMFKKKSVFSFSSTLLVTALCGLMDWGRAQKEQISAISYEGLVVLEEDQEFLELLEDGLVGIELFDASKNRRGVEYPF